MSTYRVYNLFLSLSMAQVTKIQRAHLRVVDRRQGGSHIWELSPLQVPLSAYSKWLNWCKWDVSEGSSVNVHFGGITSKQFRFLLHQHNRQQKYINARCYCEALMLDVTSDRRHLQPVTEPLLWQPYE